MHTFRMHGHPTKTYVVGFYGENIGWHALKEVKSDVEAMTWVSYLNGGDHPDKHRSTGELV